MFETATITRIPTGARAYTETEMQAAERGVRLRRAESVILPLSYFPGTSTRAYLRPDPAPRILSKSARITHPKPAKPAKHDDSIKAIAIAKGVPLHALKALQAAGVDLAMVSALG